MVEPGTREKVAGAGAVVVAALASMCCILPLGLGAIGLTGAVASAFFEPLRPYFLAVAGALLALGFYFAFRASRSGEACSTGSSGLSRASRPTLFVAALGTAVLALFPSISGLASGGADTLAPQTESSVIVLRVEGMTCESCAPGVRAHLLDVPGVIDAAVSYERKVAEVRVREERSPDLELLIQAVEKAGYAVVPEAR
jgi:mercuric ion transport protein